MPHLYGTKSNCMKKTMFVLLSAALLASCSKNDVIEYLNTPAPNNISIAPVTGKWELYKKDDVSGTNIPVNTPQRDTLYINSDKTYSWKTPQRTSAGTVTGVSAQEFRLYENGDTNNWFNTTVKINGNEITARILLAIYYFRKI